MKPYYSDPSVTLYHGDCREILPTLGQFDLCLTDPPYGTEGDGGGYGRRQNHNPTGPVSRPIAGDKDLTVAAEGIALATATISTGYIAAFCSPKRIEEFLSVVTGGGFMGEIVWDKLCPGMGFTVRYVHESCLLWAIGEPGRPSEPLMSVVRGSVNRVNTQDRHPHEKPVNFWYNILRLPGARIVDPFCGAGGVLRTAKDLGRQAVGIETEERWCEAAANRCLQETLL